MGQGSSSPARSPIPPSSQYNHPTVHGVIQVRQNLLNFFPLELVDEILRAAEYWPRIISRVAQSEELHTSAPNYDAAFLYLASRPIPRLGRSGNSARVERVVFKLESHDQGWGGEPGLVHTYAGAWSWFDAAIYRGSEIADIALMPRDVLPQEIHNLDKRSWKLQHNRRANQETKVHEVVWRRGEHKEGNVDQDGAGSGEGFIEALLPGDRIAIIARARYPGWANYVEEASIEILYSI